MDARLDRFRPTLILLRSDAPHAVPAVRFPERAALMPFTVDDRFFSHSKILAASLDERGLFVTVGTWTRGNAPSGVVPRHVLTSLGSTPDVEGRLVGHGLWRRARGGIAFEDWDFWNAPAASLVLTPTPALPDAAAPSMAPQAPVARARTAGARKQALSRSGIKQAVRNRDGDLCRYCGVKVQWGIGRASDSATYDFTDPDGPVEASNVVVSCAACHSAKGGRTAGEAGMKVLPVPACTPSDLRVSGCTPSRTPSRDTRTPSRKGYSEEMPAQKGYNSRTPSPLSDDLDFDLSLGQSVNRVEDRNAGAREKPADPEPHTPEFRLQVQGEMAARAYCDVTDDEADSITRDVLGRAKEPVPHPWGYVRKAIRGAKDPYARWLSKRPPKPAAILAEFSPAGRPHEFSLNRETGACAECKRDRVDKIHPRQKATA